MDPVPPQLDYAPPRSRKRRTITTVSVVLAAILFAPLALHWVGTIFELLRVQRLYDNCVAAAPSPQLVVYDETPSSNAAQKSSVPSWDDFCFAAASARIVSRGTLFVGELRNSKKDRRLVGVDLGRIDRKIDGQIEVTIRIFQPAPQLQTPKLRASLARSIPIGDNPKVLRLCSGQIDPADASHFIIPYTLGEQTGVIDGWLKDDDTVLLEVRP